MTHIYDLSDLEMLARDCLTRAGVGAAAAAIVARDVALAEACGEAESGFVALLRDVRLIRYGRLHVDASPVITHPAPAIVQIDAGHGFAAPAIAGAQELLTDIARKEGMGLIHLTRASDPGCMAGALISLANADLAAVALRSDGSTYAIGPGNAHIVPLASGAPGMLESLLSLAPPVTDSPLDGPVAHTAWLTALDPEVTAIGDVLAQTSVTSGKTTGGIAVAPDLLAQIVNA